jgi:hypothetical protein
LLVALSACSPSSSRQSNDVAVTLRFRPEPGQSIRENWIYDVEVPGSGILRTGLSFDVAFNRVEQNIGVRHTLRRQYYARDGAPQRTPRLVGVSISSLWGSDRSQLGDVTVESTNAEIVSAAHTALAGGRFGMLIEYPDQAVSVGDSWSIEPRAMSVGPSLQATLRPTYTLESIADDKAGERVAVIAADIQVDLVRSEVGDGVVIEGGGTASGSLRVRVRDGMLLEARTVLHFNQEVLVQGSEVLGYREFSATAHVFATARGAQPNLQGEPIKLEPADPEDERECAALLSSAAERVGRAPTQTRLYVVGALHAEALPTAAGGSAIREAGTSLVASFDGKHVELDGVMIETKELPRALRRLHAAATPLYIYAETGMPFERVRSVLALVPRGTLARLVVRDAADVAPPLKAPRWLEEQLRMALSAATPPERHQRLNQLLVDHLALCEGALDAFEKAQSGEHGYADLPARIVSAFVKCGCTTTNLDGLESTLYAMFGSPNLRFLRMRVPRPLDERRLSNGATVGDAAKLLAADAAR